MQREASTWLRQNYYPHTLLTDMDFAENYEILYACELQSNYWSHKSTTFFISISSYLDSNIFYHKRDPILDNEFVTVETPNMTPYHATVISTMGSYCVVGCTDCDGTEVQVPHAQCHHHVEMSVANRFATGYHLHDLCVTQHYMGLQIEWFVEQQKNGIINKTFKMCYFHSNNAGQHFKNKYSARYLSIYVIKYDLDLVTWSFGCSGQYPCHLNRTCRMQIPQSVPLPFKSHMCTTDALSSTSAILTAHV